MVHLCTEATGSTVTNVFLKNLCDWHQKSCLNLEFSPVETSKLFGAKHFDQFAVIFLSECGAAILAWLKFQLDLHRAIMGPCTSWPQMLTMQRRDVEILPKSSLYCTIICSANNRNIWLQTVLTLTGESFVTCRNVDSTPHEYTVNLSITKIGKISNYKLNTKISLTLTFLNVRSVFTT